MDDGKATPLKDSSYPYAPKGLTALGPLARNIDIDDDNLLREYTERLVYLKEQIVGVEGFYRSALLAQFNETWMYGVDVRTVGTNSVLYYHVVPEATEVMEKYRYTNLTRVLKLCLNTDICQKLGMSLVDFMHLEFPVFEHIEKSYYEHKPIEQGVLDDMLRQLNQQDTRLKKKS